MRYVFLVIGLLLFFGSAGCNVDRQAASNAIAGAEALERVAVEAGADQFLANDIREGVAANVRASVATKPEDMPDPSMNPSAIIDNAPQYRKDAEEAERQATAGFWFKMLSWGGSIGLLITGVLRFVPGAHQPVVSVVRSILESKTDKQAREREERLAGAAKGMIDLIDTLPPGSKIDDFKGKLMGKIPSQYHDAVREYLDQRRAAAA